MAKKRSLNARRLTKAAVREIIASGVVRRVDGPLADGLPTEAYALPGERVLVVFVGAVLNGKGDIYAKDDYERLLAWSQRVARDRKRGIFSSSDLWAHHTRFRHDFTAHVAELLANVPKVLGLDVAKMNLTYESLDLISAVIDRDGADATSEHGHDELVAYVGEVLRQRLGGRWASERGSGYPYVLLPGGEQIMPINVVQEVMGPDRPDVRGATTRESRRASLESRRQSRK